MELTTPGAPDQNDSVRYVHANAVAIDDRGILIRGASKSGKSTLTLALIDAAQARGHQVRLIGDDRIGLRAEEGRLIASGHLRIAGKMEVRGAGIIELPFVKEAEIKLVVDLAANGREFVTATDRISLCGVGIAYIKLVAQSDLQKLVLSVLQMHEKC